MLNFYDIDAVKEYIFMLLLENRELAEKLDFETKMSNYWFNRCNEMEKKAGDLKAVLEAVKKGSDECSKNSLMKNENIFKYSTIFRLTRKPERLLTSKISKPSPVNLKRKPNRSPCISRTWMPSRRP